MRCFSEDLTEKEKNPQETVVVMSCKEAKLLLNSLEFYCANVPKKKSIKERKLLSELQEKWAIF